LNLGDSFVYPQEKVVAVGSARPVATGGLTLRDYFAGQALGALHGHLSDIFTNRLNPPSHYSDEREAEYSRTRIATLAATAYALADAMLAERAKGGAA
jgi:hypothetical protein